MRREAVAVIAFAAIAVALAVLAAFLGANEPGDSAEVAFDVIAGRYFYEGEGNESAFRVPLGATVVFRVRSVDVTHGFAIAEYGVNDVVPAGEAIEVRVTATRAGTFTIFCNVFCGPGHPDHKGTLHVT